MKNEKFDKKAVHAVIRRLREEIKSLREDITAAAALDRDTQKRIKELKKQITDAGKEIKGYESLGKPANSLREFRTRLEENLEHYRDQFKWNSTNLRTSKDEIRVLEHITTLLKLMNSI
jgi:septal ring factor EnvC (AmiA/AmiB activator)